MVKNRDDTKEKKNLNVVKTIKKKHGQVTFVKRVPTPASDETRNVSGMIVEIPAPAHRFYTFRFIAIDPPPPLGYRYITA